MPALRPPAPLGRWMARATSSLKLLNVMPQQHLPPQQLRQRLLRLKPRKTLLPQFLQQPRPQLARRLRQPPLPQQQALSSRALSHRSMPSSALVKLA